MLAPTGRTTSRRAICLALAGMTTLASVRGASAEDGLGGFLSSIFGGNSAPQQTVAPSAPPIYRRSYTRSLDDRRPYLRFAPFRQRTLTVRLHKAAPKLVMAQSPTKPGVVSIYEDRTLKRGDAVMTADGIRVFAGSASWPYTKADFVDLATAKNLNKDVVNVLVEVNRPPRG